MKRSHVFSILCLVSVLSCAAFASLDLFVTTDKAVYLPGETVQVYVSVHNSGFAPQTLSFGTGHEATYLMDNTYYWHSTLSTILWIHDITISSGQTITWQLDHNSYHHSQHPLNMGMHSVHGGILSYQMTDQLSTPAYFEVIPEPATALLLGLGSISTIARKKRCG